jgi:Tfp pilus assembly protein PilX
MRKFLAKEDGIALVVALGITIVLGILVASMITYTSSSQRSAQKSSADVQATHYAESALASAYSIIVKENSTLNGNPTKAFLLGCAGATSATDVNGPSNCTGSSLQPQTVCITTTTCTAGTDGTASIYGFFSGANPANFPAGCTTGASGCVTVPASTWLLTATGYARNPAGLIDGKSTTAQVTISPLSAGFVASVWNHMFVTSPLTPGVCSLDFSGNNITANVPIYVIGNLCLGGSTINESGGNKVDVMVGGYLYLNGGNVGGTAPITSGVAAGGCTSSKTGATTSSCTNGSWNFHVQTVDDFIARDAPEQSGTDIAKDYASFDPGPKHACAAGGTLAATVFESAGSTVWDNTAGTFNLTPNSNYTCASANGAPNGELSWNNTTKVLTVTGSVFIDGSVTVTQSLTYTSVGILEFAGTLQVTGNGTHICAISTCSFTNWQGSSGNNQMLTFASLLSNATAVTFVNNTQIFQGSLWTQPSSNVSFVFNGDSIQGPISIGSIDTTKNNANFQPLPVIKNMPTGAPVPPNTSASVGPLITTK